MSEFGDELAKQIKAGKAERAAYQKEGEDFVTLWRDLTREVLRPVFAEAVGAIRREGIGDAAVVDPPDSDLYSLSARVGGEGGSVHELTFDPDKTRRQIKIRMQAFGNADCEPVTLDGVTEELVQRHVKDFVRALARRRLKPYPIH
jgi:hypothetical protein